MDQATTLDAATLEHLVTAAVAAPSMHNTQPWRFRLDPDSLTIELHAATERSLPHEDPHGRALHLAAGAAVFNLQLAVAHFGWLPVTRSLPDPGRPGLLATVRLTEAARAANSRRNDLYEAIWRRRSSRLPFTDTDIPLPVRNELTEAAHAEGCALHFPEPAEAARVLRVTAQAERRNRSDADRAAESRRWTGGHRDVGLPVDAAGPQDSFEQLPMRDFGVHRHRGDLPSDAFERRPALALLTTAHDRRADWLRAGQALQHILLVATVHQLRSSLLHQALEWPDLRLKLAAAHAPFTHAQMLLRLGHGPPGTPTPRRTARHLLAE
ncbi:hypothetical protein H9Y04_33130 [Streptomyces sp. TRM66268-LWL]|uniref:Nitroreductase domain-containing protein n=1 Tax=Streptomyces polyasparticus TaxID=2767826 RepID=A0ABR7SRG0_9ACTN|nr:hypothetical protein [Streptomyces polyasparticus]MBC9717384.1 hypothetical protein [Streptomyces polyasparticus]